MDEKKTWWQRRGWIAVGGGIVLLLIISAAAGGSNNSPSPTVVTTGDGQTTAAPQTVAPQPKPTVSQDNSAQQKDEQQTSSDGSASTQNPPRNSDGTIVQLKITATAQSRSIAFSSQANYTNCSNGLTVITTDGNGQPTFTKYTDNHSAGLNLFTGDQHSIAYGSLTGGNGDTLSADIISGMYGSNAAGVWGLSCDQGQYSLTINAIQ
jgi:hypothetical protein